jgi:hypothetical protein
MKRDYGAAKRNMRRVKFAGRTPMASGALGMRCDDLAFC